MPPITLRRPVNGAGARAGFALIAMCLAQACNFVPRGSARTSAAAAASQTERAYRPPPRLTAVQADRSGVLILTGSADPLAPVRLSSPAGQAGLTQADGAGHWRLALPSAREVRLFGLAMRHDGQWLQAPGYLALLPSGTAALLRSGSGSIVLRARATTATQVLSADFDSRRGSGPVAAVISGLAAPGRPLALAVDGQVQARTAAARDGRFAAALDAPLAPGPHVLQASGAPAPVRIVIAPARPLATAPFRAAPFAGGWRIDWLTPGGGEQSTLVFGN